MLETRTIIANVQNDFEGGNSLSVDWDNLLKRAVRTVVRQVRPATLKRTVPVYAGLADGITIYYCPDAVLVPSTLYTNTKETEFDYIPFSEFKKSDRTDVYSISYVNGARFLFVKHGDAVEGLTIDDMSELGTKSGGSASYNNQMYLFGSGAVEATFTEAGIEFGDDVTLDISEYYVRGAVFIPAYVPTASDIVSLEFRLKTDDSNYYSITTAGKKAGDYLVDGWNRLLFEMAGKTTTGTPDPANITEWTIIGTTTTGKTSTIIFDKVTIQNQVPYFLDFYTDAVYVDGVSGALWKTNVSYLNNDKIFLDRDVENILHYELCLLVTQSSTFDRVDGQATSRFQGQLAREYEAYWSVHPSDEEPISYDRQPQM